MDNFVDITYFTGDINITNLSDPSKRARVEKAIAKYQKKYLID